MDKKSREELKEAMQNTEICKGEHIFLQCSSCQEDLVDIWITKPDVSLKTKMVASCCFCDNKSFSKVIDGSFHLGVTEKTNISTCESLDDDDDVLQNKVNLSYLIHTMKAE